MTELSERIRGHALGVNGGEVFYAIDDDGVFKALIAYKHRDEPSCTFTPNERRMFALFVSYAVEDNE